MKSSLDAMTRVKRGEEDVLEKVMETHALKQQLLDEFASKEIDYEIQIMK